MGEKNQEKSFYLVEIMIRPEVHANPIECIYYIFFSYPHVASVSSAGSLAV